MRSPNASRSWVAGTIGNSDNNVTIEKASGAAWGQERYFVITPDAVMQREVTAALLRAGVSNANQVFTDPVAKDLVRVGLGPKADDLMILFRYARPDDEEAGEKWREQLPMAVLRVRDKNTRRKTEPYPTPTYDQRIAKSELGLEGPHNAINRSAVLTGVGNVFDVNLAGSAKAFSRTVKSTDRFYVYYFARDCTGLSNCFTVTEEMIPKGELMTFISRDYIVPGTTRGADPKQRLNPTTIILNGQMRH